MTVLKDTNMFHPISDDVFEQMTKDYLPEVKANKRAGLDFLNSIMKLNATDAALGLSNMRKTIGGLLQNLTLLEMTEAMSPKPVDINKPLGELMNDILQEQEAKDLTPKSKAERESRNFDTAH